MLDVALTPDDREFLIRYIKTGTKKARAIARAKILLLSDEGHTNDEISKMTEVHRQSIWRIKKRFIEEGIISAIEDKPRSGQPRKYSKKQEAEIIAMACTDPPKGRKRWSIRLLTEKMKTRKGFETINRETIRLILKKQKLDLG